ncbi:putative transmembrane protein [Toxoplasma gondii VAND]|uniref:Putative transmembrane protein n=1 Tax=Toxoplasma gondii VAND TaxID=933077 RepID=A0A086PMU2_TOXGO|nr:putative transmembrane protein [Toxoplasma gondii VAND]
MRAASIGWWAVCTKRKGVLLFTAVVSIVGEISISKIPSVSGWDQEQGVNPNGGFNGNAYTYALPENRGNRPAYAVSAPEGDSNESSDEESLKNSKLGPYKRPAKHFFDRIRGRDYYRPLLDRGSRLGLREHGKGESPHHGTFHKIPVNWDLNFEHSPDEASEVESAVDSLLREYREMGRREAELISLSPGGHDRSSSRSSLARLAITAGLISAIGGGMLLTFPVVAKALAVAAAVGGVGSTMWGVKQVMRGGNSSKSTEPQPGGDINSEFAAEVFATEIEKARHSLEGGREQQKSSSKSDGTKSTQTQRRRRHSRSRKHVKQKENEEQDKQTAFGTSLDD